MSTTIVSFYYIKNLDLDDKDDKDFSGQSGRHVYDLSNDWHQEWNYSQTDEAKKHRCEFAGCGRTYKNLQGLKYNFND